MLFVITKPSDSTLRLISHHCLLNKENTQIESSPHICGTSLCTFKS